MRGWIVSIFLMNLGKSPRYAASQRPEGPTSSKPRAEAARGAAGTLGNMVLTMRPVRAKELFFLQLQSNNSLLPLQGANHRATPPRVPVPLRVTSALGYVLAGLSARLPMPYNHLLLYLSFSPSAIRRILGLG